MKFRTPLRLAVLLLLATACLLLATCISAEEQDYIRYDAAKDEFQMLMVLRNISVKDSDDLAYLEGIFRNRDHLIAPIIPGAANLFPLISVSLIRVSDTSFYPLNIYTSRPSELEIVESAAPLASIRITPGTFFLQNKTLGYYQAIAIPGKTIDLALEQISKAAQNEDAIKSIKEEIDRRAGTAGAAGEPAGKVYTWADLTDQTLKELVIEPPPATQAQAKDESINPMMVLELQSLKNLQQAITDKTLHLRREKQSILLSLPLTAKDGAAFADLVKQVSKRLDDVLRTAKETPETLEKISGFRAMQALGRSLTITADDKALTASIDLLTLAQSITALPSHLVTADEPATNRADAPDPIRYLKEHNITIDETLTAEDILRTFNAGTLKSFPSENPVKPGQGITSTQPGK